MVLVNLRRVVRPRSNQEPDIEYMFSASVRAV
jgi:hypothetical protein